MPHGGDTGNSSRLLIERARAVTAAENYDIAARLPTIIRHAEGAWLEDEDRRFFLDLTAANGTVLLGHHHPRVTEAVIRQVRHQAALFPTTISALRIELAERLCERYPVAEKVIFFRSGSEATTAAIRLARAATGRRIVLSSGYHGWHDWHLGYRNLTFNAPCGVVHFGYNLGGLAKMLDSIGQSVACVIVTPELSQHSVDFFCKMSRLCQRHDVLFILDEVMSGLRYGPGGVHGTGGVPADLVVISKCLANGHALAAVLGTRSLVNCFDDARLAGTYTREVLPMAAAIATLDVLDEEPVYDASLSRGERLRDGMAHILSEAGLPAWVSGHPLMFRVVYASEELAAQVYRRAFAEGLYLEPGGTQMITYAHGEAEIDRALSSFEVAVRLGGGTFTDRNMDVREIRIAGTCRDNDDELTTEIIRQVQLNLAVNGTCSSGPK